MTRRRRRLLIVSAVLAAVIAGAWWMWRPTSDPRFLGTWIWSFPSGESSEVVFESYGTGHYRDRWRQWDSFQWGVEGDELWIEFFVSGMAQVPKRIHGLIQRFTGRYSGSGGPSRYFIVEVGETEIRLNPTLARGDEYVYVLRRVPDR